MTGINDGYGDTQNWDRLIYTIAAERISGHSDWDDAIQEARIRVWEMYSQGKIPDDLRSPGGYIGKIVRRRITEVVTRQLWTGMETKHGQPTDPLRSEARDSLEDPDISFEASAPEIIDAISLAYHYGEIVQAINTLPIHQREYVVLRFWGGLTGAEIAAKQDRPLGTVDREWTTKIRPALSVALQHLQPA